MRQRRINWRINRSLDLLNNDAPRRAAESSHMEWIGTQNVQQCQGGSLRAAYRATQIRDEQQKHVSTWKQILGVLKRVMHDSPLKAGYIQMLPLFLVNACLTKRNIRLHVNGLYWNMTAAETLGAGKSSRWLHRARVKSLSLDCDVVVEKKLQPMRLQGMSKRDDHVTDEKGGGRTTWRLFFLCFFKMIASSKVARYHGRP